MRFCASACAFVLAIALHSPLLACEMKLSQFHEELLRVDEKVAVFEKLVLQLDAAVDDEAAKLLAISYGTACPNTLTKTVEQTSSRLADLAHQMHGLDKFDDGFFACVIDLRRRGNEALERVRAANDTTRTLLVQQALKDLTDYDLKSTDISIRISVLVSKAERLARGAAMNEAICKPESGGLNAIDF